MPRLEIEGDFIRLFPDEGEPMQLAWGELTAVRILTSEPRPGERTRFVLLIDAGGRGVTVPGTVAEPLLARLRHLPRFDEAALEASQAASGLRQFLAWQGDPGEARLV
jgi:hypothetical protein